MKVINKLPIFCLKLIMGNNGTFLILAFRNGNHINIY